MPSLRGHHLVCLHFFSGEGYDEAFIQNLRNILTRVNNDEVTITSGADDVCTSCLYLSEGQCDYTKDADRDIRDMDKTALDLLNLSVTGQTGWDELRDRVRTIFPDWYPLYCSDCAWRKACEKSEFFQEMLERYISTA